MKNSLRYLVAGVILSIGVATSANAATATGINFAFSLPGLTGTPAEQTNSVLGYKIGGYMAQPLNDSWTLSYGLEYEKKGSALKTPAIGTLIPAGNSVLTLGYLQVPVVAKYAVTKSIDLEVGGYAGLLVGAETRFGSSVVEDKSAMESFELGLILGSSYQISSNLEAELQYEMGITNISKQANNPGVTNRALSLGVNYQF